MDLASYCYTRLLASRGISHRFWNRVRKWLVRYAGDPECNMPVHGRQLCMPLSHDLPNYLNAHPCYDQLPRRLSDLLHGSGEPICAVDVGANIGDSVAAIAQHPRDLFLAIEPNPHFYQYLEKNWTESDSVVPLQVICSSSDEKRSFIIDEKRGTASVVEAPADTGSQSPQSLDTLVEQHVVKVSGATSTIDLIKIDTDGHDFEVLAGARETIRKHLPVILFECDVFTNQQYAEQIADNLAFFSLCGYESFMVYDNFGHLMGRFALSDSGAFHGLVLYQLTSPFLYFDIVVMKSPDIDAFYQSETQFFVDRIQDQRLHATATKSAQLALRHV